MARGYRLVWEDEFQENLLDAGKWRYRTDSKMWSTQLPRNVSVEGGRLQIALKKEEAGGKEYTGGGVISRGTFLYGYYECRMKMPAAAGWHSSFWLMKDDGNGSTGTGARTQEIDVVEQDSVSPRQYSAGVHDWNVEAGAKKHPEFGRHHPESPEPLSAGFHVFGCEFTPEVVRFYRDGVKTGECDATRFCHGPVNVWVTCIASPLGGAKAVEDKRLPDALEVEYVRVFERGDKRGGR